MDAEWPVSIDGIEPVKMIGSGGFGQVWLARQTDLDRKVAVKVGHRPFTSDDDRRRFERECMALGRLSGHANILDVYTSGLSNGLPYLVLAFVEGGTLADHGPSLGEARLRAVTDQLCQAVGAAHAIGVLHRDLKPENVFLELNGTAILGDFGIARLGDGNNTEAGGVTASMAFAAPEILEGRPPSPAADVYGIGVTMMSAVLGHSPFVTAESTTLEAIIAQVLRGEPPSLANHGISPGFEALLRRAMHKNPELRHASADELRNELAALPAAHSSGAAPTVASHGIAPGGPTPSTAGYQAPPSQQYQQAPPGQISGGQQPVGHYPSAQQPFQAGGTGPGPIALTTNGSNGGNRPMTTIAVLAGVGVAALLGVALLVFALRPDSADDPGEAAADAPANTDDSTAETSGDNTEPTGSTGTSIETTTSTTTAPTPLGIPLTGPEISDLTPIPFDFNGNDPLLGPANSPQFCDQEPDITGLTETIGALYPIDPTTDESLRQVAQRMHRFSTPEQATNFIATYTTFACESWEADGFNHTAEVVPPSLRVGDEIVQVDQVSTLPTGIDILSRTVLVRSGAEVYKLVFYTIDTTELAGLSDALVTRAIENLGY